MSENSSDQDEGFGRSMSGQSSAEDLIIPSFDPPKRHKLGSWLLIQAK